MNVSGAHRYQVVVKPVTVRFVDLKDGYRYGFGEQENDKEEAGEGNSCDFRARIYDEVSIRCTT